MSVRIERVIELANQAISAIKDPWLIKRVGSAVEIILDGNIVSLADAGFYRVFSRTREGLSYQVAQNYCECEDYCYREIACAHRIAAWLIAEAARPANTRSRTFLGFPVSGMGTPENPFAPELSSHYGQVISDADELPF
jgi:hypothetical protein